MEAEIISVSSELLRGQIANVNAEFLTRELTSLGIEVTQCLMVGDSPESLEEAVKQAEERANLLIITGGLGPNENDNTKKVISGHLGVPLVLDRETENRIITYHKNADFTMPEDNQLQALVLQDSTPIQNVTGLAAGMFYQKGKYTYILLPGPIDELKPTYLEKTRPLIIKELLQNTSVITKYLRLFGITPAELSRKLDGVLSYHGNPFAGAYFEKDEIEIQITSRAETKKEAEKKAAEVEEAIKERVSDYIYSDRKNALPDVVKNLLKENDLQVTAAESLTGGAFLSTFSSELEAGSIFSGGIVTYSSEMKNKALGVTKNTLEEFGVVSSQCAIEMAEKSKKMFDADIGVSLTGVAGPSSLEDEIPGTVWIGIAKEGSKSFAKQYHFAYKRNRNRRLSVLSAMNLVRLVILDEPINNKVFWDEEEHGKEVREEQQ